MMRDRREQLRALPIWDSAHAWNSPAHHADWQEEKHRLMWQHCGETAIHEAGHAVVAYLLGRELDLVTIDPKDKGDRVRLGACFYRRWYPSTGVRFWFQSHLWPHRTAKQVLRDEAAIALAGVIAVVLVHEMNGSDNDMEGLIESADYDMYRLGAFVHWQLLTAGQQRGYWLRSGDRAVRLLTSRRSVRAVHDVARRLIERTTIGSNEATAIIRAALGEKIPRRGKRPVSGAVRGALVAMDIARRNSIEAARTMTESE
jgi:hypothetical protein